MKGAMRHRGGLPPALTIIISVSGIAAAVIAAYFLVSTTQRASKQCVLYSRDWTELVLLDPMDYEPGQRMGYLQIKAEVKDGDKVAIQTPTTTLTASVSTP